MATVPIRQTTRLSGAFLRELRQDLELTIEAMAHILDVDPVTVSCWERMVHPLAPAIQRERLDKLREIATLGQIVYRGDGFRLFLTTPLASFDGQTATQLIEARQFDRVIGALAGDYEGLGH